jgi:hypothetical protein
VVEVVDAPTSSTRCLVHDHDNDHVHGWDWRARLANPLEEVVSP